MLEAVDLAQTIERDDYKRRIKDLRWRLFRLQRAASDARVANIIVFEGWDASGKGSTIKKLTERLEPRAFTLHSTRGPRTFETHLPWMWRFWNRIPNWGEMAIFHRSWYRWVISRRAGGVADDQEWLRACRDIRFFEDALFDDRYVITKFFLHIDRDEQRRRFEKMAADPELSWRITDGDRERIERYDEHRVAVEETLQQTETEWGPWTLVAAHDKYWTRVRVFETLAQRIEEGLRKHGVTEIEYLSEANLELDSNESLDG